MSRPSRSFHSETPTGSNTFGTADSESRSHVRDVTDLVEPRADATSDADSAEAEIRNRVERVRRRELDDALARLESRGGLAPEQRRVVAALSADLADALADRWTAALGDDATDAEVVRELLVE